MKRLLVFLLAAMLVTAAGLSGCSQDKEEKTDTPAASESAGDKDAKADKGDKAEEAAPAEEEEEVAEPAGDAGSVGDFGREFCDSIQSEPNSFGSFLAIRPLMRIGLELEFANDPDAEEMLEVMDIEAMVDMGIEQSGIEQMEFPMMQDIGMCEVHEAETVDCSEIAATLATDGMMGEDLIPEEITRKALDAYDITECGVLTLEGDDGLLSLGLLNYEGEWKMITLWE